MAKQLSLANPVFARDQDFSWGDRAECAVRSVTANTVAGTCRRQRGEDIYEGIENISREGKDVLSPLSRGEETVLERSGGERGLGIAVVIQVLTRYARPQIEVRQEHRKDHQGTLGATSLVHSHSLTPLPQSMKVVASTKLARAERAMRAGKAYGTANQGRPGQVTHVMPSLPLCPSQNSTTRPASRRLRMPRSFTSPSPRTEVSAAVSTRPSPRPPRRPCSPTRTPRSSSAVTSPRLSSRE